MERMHLVRFSKEGNCRRQRFIVKCGICGDTRIYENEDGSRLSINRPDPKSKRLDISYAELPEEWVPLFELYAGFNWSYDGNLIRSRSEKCPNCHILLFSGYIPGSFIHDLNLDLLGVYPNENKQEMILQENGLFSKIQDRLEDHLKEYKSKLIWEEYNNFQHKLVQHIQKKKQLKLDNKRKKKERRNREKLDRCFKDILSEFEKKEFIELTRPRACSQIERISGVYIMYDLVKTPVYVGQSRVIKNRLISHKERYYDTTYAKYIPIPESDLDFVESLLISRIKPLHNKNNGRTQLAEKFWKKDNKG